VLIGSADDIGSAAESAAAFGEAGIDLVVINLPHRASPQLLEPIAERFSQLS
jgi:hypothetical protein